MQIRRQNFFWKHRARYRGAGLPRESRRAIPSAYDRQVPGSLFASLRVPLREARFFGGRRATRICRLARPVPLPYWAITNDTGRVNVPVWSGANFQLLRTQRAAALARIGGPDAGSAETTFPAET